MVMYGMQLHPAWLSLRALVFNPFFATLCELKKDVACTAGLYAKAVSGCAKMGRGVVCMRRHVLGAQYTGL